MSGITVTNPGTIRTFSHKAQMRRWQNSPRFRKMKADHALIPGAVCAHCGRHHGDPIYDRHGNQRLTRNGKPRTVSLTINHLSYTTSLTEELYLTWDSVTMEICCSDCNGWYRKGMIVCPVCKSVPILALEPRKMCIWCYLDANPEVREQIEESKRKRARDKRQYNANQAQKRKVEAKKHTCKNRRVRGVCGKSMINSQCPYGVRKASKMCSEFEARVKA